MGYKAILVFERLALALGGQLVAQWPETNTPTASGEFPTHCGRGAYWVLSQDDRPGPNEQRMPLNHLRMAIDHVVVMSKGYPQIPFLVGRCLDYSTWH